VADNESVDRIVDQIKEDGEKEISSILEKAERTASEIIEKARDSVDEIAGKILKEAEEKGDLARRRLLSSVNIEVKRAKLKAREEIVSKINEDVERGLADARAEAGYPELLAELIVEAVRGLDGDTFQVYVDRRDIGLIDEKVFGMVREAMAAESRNISGLEAMLLEKNSIGGARVGVPGGKVIFDNTFEARIYRLRDRTRNIIFEEVFESGGSEGSGSA
jgi:V/A-type H+-transporting ATPase subunit E